MNNDRLENIVLKKADAVVPVLGKGLYFKEKKEYFSEKTFGWFDCNPECSCNTTCNCDGHEVPCGCDSNRCNDCGCFSYSCNYD